MQQVWSRVRQTTSSKQGCLSEPWYLGEINLKDDGQLQYLWRAVEPEGNVVDILVQSRRDSSAVKRLFRKLLGKEYTAANRVIADRLIVP